MFKFSLQISSRPIRRLLEIVFTTSKCFVVNQVFVLIIIIAILIHFQAVFVLFASADLKIAGEFLLVL
jgi:hypothetical protein